MLWLNWKCRHIKWTVYLNICVYACNLSLNHVDLTHALAIITPEHKVHNTRWNETNSNKIKTKNMKKKEWLKSVYRWTRESLCHLPLTIFNAIIYSCRPRWKNGHKTNELFIGIYISCFHPAIKLFSWRRKKHDSIDSITGYLLI